MRVRRLQGLTGSLPPATYADSTNVANFARAAQDFYNDPNNGYVAERAWSPERYSGMYGAADWDSLINQLIDSVREQNVMAGAGDMGIAQAINAIKTVFGNDLTATDFMRMANDPNQVIPTDLKEGFSNLIFNPNAPDPVFDKRILPDKIRRYTYTDPQFQVGPQDLTDIPEYDPVMVTPWQDLTDDEKDVRLKKAYTTGNLGGIPWSVIQTSRHTGVGPSGQPVMHKTTTNKNPYTGSSTGLFIDAPFEMPSLPPSQIPTEAMMEREIAPMMRVKRGDREPQTIYKQDPRVSAGQYPVGERIWDEDKKRWVERMWDKEMQRDSRELAKPRKERWRTIETPPGGFNDGGKIKVKRKDSNVDPKKDKIKHDLMKHYLNFVNNASYNGVPAKKVQGWPKQENMFAVFDSLAPNYNDPDYQVAANLADDYYNAYTDALFNKQYNPSQNKYKSDIIFHPPSDDEIAYLNMSDSNQKSDQYVSIPRPNFRIDEMNPFEVVGVDQKMLNKQLQTPTTQRVLDSIKTEPIMKADSSVKGGQYQVGERVWDPKKKKWQNRMWDREDKKASRELNGVLKERWRTIETPPGGFMNGGKIRVKKKC